VNSPARRLACSSSLSIPRSSPPPCGWSSVDSSIAIERLIRRSRPGV